MSGEVAKVSTELQHGPQAHKKEPGPFSARQLSRLDEALTLSSRETGLTFSVYVGEFKPPARAQAKSASSASSTRRITRKWSWKRPVAIRSSMRDPAMRLRWRSKQVCQFA